MITERIMPLGRFLLKLLCPKYLIIGYENSGNVTNPIPTRTATANHKTIKTSIMSMCGIICY